MSNDTTLLRIVVVVGLLVVLLPILAMLFMLPFMGMWGGGHMWNGGMWNGTGATWPWTLLWLVFLAVIVGIGYLLYRTVGGSSGADTDPALEELRVAYARGELSDEEFENRRERLKREQ